jgi:hypothetical protein
MASEDDDFALFDSDSDDDGNAAAAPAPAANSAPPTAYGTTNMTLSGLRDHVMACIAPNLPMTLQDLVAQKEEGALAVSAALATAFSSFDSGKMAEAAESAQVVVEATWNALQEYKQWPEKSWCEAHIFCRILLSYVECKGERYMAGVQHVDLALVLGAPPEAMYQIIEYAEGKLGLGGVWGKELEATLNHPWTAAGTVAQSPWPPPRAPGPYLTRISRSGRLGQVAWSQLWPPRGVTHKMDLPSGDWRSQRIAPA